MDHRDHDLYHVAAGNGWRGGMLVERVEQPPTIPCDHYSTSDENQPCPARATRRLELAITGATGGALHKVLFLCGEHHAIHVATPYAFVRTERDEPLD
jgi:hypothetical protein